MQASQIFQMMKKNLGFVIIIKYKLNDFDPRSQINLSEFFFSFPLRATFVSKRKIINRNGYFFILFIRGHVTILP